MTARPAQTKAIAPAVPLLASPGAWAESALCAQADPDAWFPGRGQHVAARRAIQVCGRCPVRAECLELALSGADSWGGIVHGVWGGTTPNERIQLRRQRKETAA